MEQAIGATQPSPTQGFDRLLDLIQVDPAAAIPWGKRILTQPRLDRLTQARTFHILCHLSASVLRRSSVEAAFHGHEAVRLAREVGGYRGQQLLCDSLASLGIAAERIGEYDRAIDAYREALHMPLDWLERRSREVELLTLLGHAHYYNREYEVALSTFDQAWSASEKQKGGAGRALLQSMRGMCFLRMDELDIAESYIRVAAQAVVADPFLEARTRCRLLAHMAICRQIIRDWEEAEEYAQQAIGAAAEVDEPYGQVIGKLVLANCARRTRRVQEAVELSAAASRQAFEYGYVPLIQEQVWLLGYLYG